MGTDNIPDELNPQYKIEDSLYHGAEAEGYMTEVNHRIIKPLHRANATYMDLSEYMFHRRVALERHDMFNTRGWTKEWSELRMAEMNAMFGGVLGELSDTYWEIRKDWLIDQLDEADMFSKKLMDKVRDNAAYATFDVVDYIEKRHGATASPRIYRQHGTFKDVAPPFLTTIMKNISLMRSVHANNAARAVIDFYEEFKEDLSEGGKKFIIKDADTQWNGQTQAIQPTTNPDQGLIVVMESGKAKGYYVDKYIATQFERNPAEARIIVDLLRAMTTPFRIIFTGVRPGFWLYNVQRDFWRAVKLLPSTAWWNTAESKHGAVRWAGRRFRFDAARFATHWVKNLHHTVRSVYGIPDPVIKRMQKDQMLISVANYRGEHDQGDMNERLLVRYNVAPGKWDNKITKPAKMLWYHFENIGKISERASKVGAYSYLKKHFPDMSSQRISHEVRNAGSPQFLRQGTETPLLNNFLIFSNAQKEGWRGSAEVIRERPMEYVWKTAKYNLLPQAVQIVAAMGLLNWMVPWLDEMYERISEYNKTNSINVPLWMTKNGKVVYVRLPHDDEGRLSAGIMWKMFKQNEDKMWADILSYMGGQAPTITPLPRVMFSVAQYVSGINPYDSFRRRHVIPEQIHEASLSGDAEAKKEARKIFRNWISNQLGGGIVKRFRYEDPNEVKTELEKFLGKPFVGDVIGRFIQVSDYGVTEELTKVRKKLRGEAYAESQAARRGFQKLIDTSC